VVRQERKNINVATLKKVKQFLKEHGAVFKSDIVKGASVDFHSVGLAISMLNVRILKDGKIKLK